MCLMGEGLRVHILQECHETPLGGHFGRHKTAALIRWLAYWPVQTRDVDAYVRSCEVCQRTKADHVGPRGLLYPLLLPSRRGRVIGLDWLLGLPMTASGFDQVQVHVDHLSGRVHVVPTRATDTRRRMPHGSSSGQTRGCHTPSSPYTTRPPRSHAGRRPGPVLH